MGVGGWGRVRASVVSLQDARRLRLRSPAPSLARGQTWWRRGFPLTRAWGFRQPRVEGRRRSEGAGLGRERKKVEGQECGVPQPATQRRATSCHGHCHDPPCHAHARGMGRTLDVTWEGRPSTNWIWTQCVPLPLQQHHPHSRS